MAGSLIQVDTYTVSSSSATIPVNGIDSDNVYMLACYGFVPDSTNPSVFIRVNKSSSAQTDSEYDVAFLGMYTGGTFVHEGDTGRDSCYIYNTYEETTATGRGNGLVMYLFNFNESEYSNMTIEQTYSHSAGATAGNQGGCIHTVASASDGIQFLWSAAQNFEEGDFKLYGLSK